jgi:hypothetical protein
MPKNPPKEAATSMRYRGVDLSHQPAVDHAPSFSVSKLTSRDRGNVRRLKVGRWLRNAFILLNVAFWMVIVVAFRAYFFEIS